MKKAFVYLKNCLLMVAAVVNKLFKKKHRQPTYTAVADDILFV